MRVDSMVAAWLNVLNKYKLPILFAAVVILLGHFIGTYFYNQGKQIQKHKLMDTTTMAAASLDVDKLQILKNDIHNDNNVIFKEFNAQFDRIGDKAKNLGVIWIYAMYLIDDKIYFSFDSTIPGDSDYEPPGGEYKEPPTELLQLVKDKKPVVTDLYTDEYGTYISAFIPIVDEETGELVAIIGSDIESSIYNSEVRKYLVFPLLSTCLAVGFVLLVSAYFSREKKARGKIEDALKRAQHEKAKADLLLAEMGEPIVVCDEHGVIAYVNKAGIEAMGCKKELVEGKTIFEIFSVSEEKGNTLAIFRNLFQEMMTKKKKVIFSSLDSGVELISNITGKKFQVILNLSPILYSDRVIGMIGVLTDISHIVGVDRMKSEFISLASHQLRTPLSKMRWMTEMLLDDDSAEVSSSQRELTKSIYDTNQQLISLVTSLLNISRIESGRIAINPIRIDLKNSIKPIVSLIKFCADQKKQKLIIEIDKNLPEVSLDFKLVGEVYKNLLRNAVKYTPDKGEIVLKIYKNNDLIISEVKDNGYGIPENAREKMFQKFFRADNIKKIETDGSGLGLYLAKIIVESSGGKIWYESAEGRGSKFYFSLPIAGIKHKEGSVTLEDNDNKI